MMHSFNDLMVAKTRLEGMTDNASKELKRFPRDASGLVPAEVKNDLEYKTAKMIYDDCFSSLRLVNSQIMKHHKKQYLAWRKENKA